MTETGNTVERVLVRVRPGVGGAEAERWASEVSLMLGRFTRRLGLEHERKEDRRDFVAWGPDALRKLWGEAGTHRMQRAPIADPLRRIHTMTAVVSISPDPAAKIRTYNEVEDRVTDHRSRVTVKPLRRVLFDSDLEALHSQASDEGKADG